VCFSLDISGLLIVWIVDSIVARDAATCDSCMPFYMLSLSLSVCGLVRWSEAD
jgi:hypothetical protein